jgi:hypothetical protein
VSCSDVMHHLRDPIDQVWMRETQENEGVWGNRRYSTPSMSMVTLSMVMAVWLEGLKLFVSRLGTVGRTPSQKNCISRGKRGAGRCTLHSVTEKTEDELRALPGWGS